jgi:hypothetical protein
MFALGLLAGAGPRLVVLRVPRRRLSSRRRAWWLSLCSSSALVLTLGWCSLRIAAAGGGVAVVVRAVVIGMLLGVGRTVVLLVETSLVLLKLKGKKVTHKWDQEVSPPGPAAGLLFGPPRPRRSGADWLLLLSPLPPWSHLGGGGCSCRCCAPRAPRVVVVPVPVPYA